MRNLYNLFFVVFVAFLAGCAGTAGLVGGGDGWGVAGWDGRNAGQAYPGGRVRVTDPCQPFQAGGLMSWATELEGQQRHQRGANVSVSPDGRVQCSSHEAGSSQYQGGGQQRMVQQYRPQAAPVQQYREPVIQGWSH